MALIAARTDYTRVGHITTWLSTRGGGIPAVVMPLAGALRSTGVETSVFGLLDKGAEPTATAAGVAIQAYQPLWGGRLGYSRGMTRGLRVAGFDLLHQHGLWQYPSIACLRWHAATSAPYIVSPHGMLDRWALRNSYWKKALAGGVFEKRHLQMAACVHALNVAELRAVREYGLRTPVAVVPNGIDLPKENECDAPSWIRRVPVGAQILLFLGRIHPKKGLPGLIRAWASSRSENWCLVIAGWDQGGHESELEKMVSELALADRVLFVGPLFGREKDASFRASNAFVLPSFSEGLPMSVLEAWSYRLPVLMTAACNLPEGFLNGAAVELPLEQSAMGSALTEFLNLSEERLRSMGRAGRQLVESRFTWQQVASEMTNVYQWMLGGGAPPASVDC